MTDLQIFKNPEFGEIRTIEKDGEPWFVGKDERERILQCSRHLWRERI